MNTTTRPEPRLDTSETSETSGASGTSETSAPAPSMHRYLAPDAFTRRVFNPLVAALTRLGWSIWGSRVLEVPGRTTGAIRSTPVNVLVLDGSRYLVAPRGVTQWVRNVRVAGWCRLRVGRRVEEVALTELPDAVKPAILRAYLRRWRWEVGTFFEGVGPEAADDELLALAGRYPVFILSART